MLDQMSYTCKYDILYQVKYFVSHSWKIVLLREITKDLIEDMIHVSCDSRGVCF